MEEHNLKPSKVIQLWSYLTEAKQNNCSDWFEDVVDSETKGIYYQLPTATVANDHMSALTKQDGAQSLQFPQLNEGVYFCFKYESIFTCLQL